jgi:molybdate/tungstate transport system ATP-binding protein
MSLEITGLERRYGEFALGPLDLTVEPGVTAVLGPSGSGKSTLLELIAGFESPDDGRITVNGRRLDELPPEDRSVGMVFQNYALFPHLSVRENLAFGATGDAAVEEAARMLEIEALLGRRPETLSGGEAQRVALARALVSDPDVLLLDEPLSSLDAPIRRRLRLELHDVLTDLSIPVVYVTHDQQEAAIVGDRLAVLDEGRLVREGPVEAVFERPRSTFVAEFLGIENVVVATVTETNGQGTVVDVGGTTLSTTDDPPAAPVAVAIHPDAVAVGHEQTSERENVLDCTVQRVLTHHTDATVVLDCAGRAITATLDTEAAGRLVVGQDCQAVVAPSDVHLTRRDR